MSKLKILASHPVQYQAPIFRKLIDYNMDVDVRYYHQGAAGRLTIDEGFGIEIEWDIDLLSGYSNKIIFDGMAKFNYIEQLKISYRLFEWVFRDQDTPLLIMGWFAEVIWLVWLFRILAKKPVMVMGDNTIQSFNDSPKPAWRIGLLRWLLKRTTAILYVGERNLAFWKEMGVSDSQLFFTPHSVDSDRFKKKMIQLLPQRRELCQRYGLDPELPVFLFCGKLISIKRPLQLFDSFLKAGLAEKAQLLFVGEGALRLEIEQRIKETNSKNVHLIGFFNQSQMPMAYVLGDILCLPSISENWGLVVNEALVCGRPVIISETVGCGPDLVSVDNGWVFPGDNIGVLVKVLYDAYERREVWEKMGRNGQKNISRHTFSSMAVGIQSALEMIAIVE